jgi:transcriptional regulator with XRE-family HTH domain/Zn-dependent peptidase ImmA (M78 family)
MALHERLRHARNRVGLTLEQVAERVGVSAPSLSAYETGHREPGFALLAKLAKVYHRPVEFFFSEEPLHAEAVVWRAKPPSPLAEELETKLLELGDRYRSLEDWGGCVTSARLPKFEWSAEDVDVARLAFQVRGFLRLGERPGADLLRAVEDAGVKVFFLPFEPRTGSASTVGETIGPTVLLNALASRRDRIYSLAHELFHLLTWGQFRGEGAAEKAEALADHFASCLLLPEEPLRLAVSSALRGGKLTFRELDAIAKSFDVPLEPFLWRVGEVFGRPHKDTRRDVLRLKAGGSLGAEAPEAAPTRPERFQRLAVKAYEEGKLAIGRLADYLGISRQEAMRRFFHDDTESLADEEVSLAPPGR